MFNKRARLFLINTLFAAAVLAAGALVFGRPMPSSETVILTAFVVSWVEMGG